MKFLTVGAKLGQAFSRCRRLSFAAAIPWLILLLAPWLIIPAAADGPRPYYFGQTTDATPVNLAMQDADGIVQFRIPKSYLSFSENWKGGLQTVVNLEVVAPKMSPRSITKESLASPNVIDIHLYSFVDRGGNHSVRSTIDRAIDRKWWIEVDRYLDAQGQSYKIYVSSRDVEKRKNKSMMIKEIFVPEENGGADIYFDCLREAGNNSVGCGAILNYGKDISLEFHFRRTEFEKWREMRQLTNQLLDQFRTAANRE
jgi:hypothetical protein